MAKKKRRKGSLNKSLFAYTDESGNTGENLFDEAQPLFWTGTLLSTQDLEVIGTQTIQECQSLLGVNELHGKDLGFSGIAKVALRMESLIEKYDCLFLFTITEKIHRAAIRLAEILLDSDFNQAVSPSHDLLFPFRRMLTLPLVGTLARSDKKKFWQAYVNGNHKQFCEVLETLQFRIYDGMTDPRGKQLLLDAISWALKYPEVVLRPKPTKDNDPYSLDSPNIQAFISLIDGLHGMVKSLEGQVVRFCHDEQKQFGRAIRETFDVLHKVTLPRDSLLLQKIKTFGCPIELVPSHLSVGLQLIDMCLWMMVKTYKISQPPALEQFLSLLACITRRAIIKEYSFDQLVEDSQKDYRRIMSRDISPEQLAKGKQFTDEQEARRIRKMSMPPE